MTPRLVSVIAVLLAWGMPTAQAQQKRIYLAPDDHTDFIWSDSEANYHTHFLNMLDYYQQKADETAGNPPDFRSKFTIDGTLWLETYAANRTPAQFDALMQKIKEGHITAPLAPLCVSYGVMPAEAVLRGMYYSGRLERRYSMRFPLAQAMENGTMALGVGSLWAGSGAKYVWQGICGCDTKLPNLSQREDEMYLWRGRDGSSLLTKWFSLKDNQSLGGYAEARNPAQAVDWVTTQAAGNGFTARHPWPVVGIFGQGWDDLATMNLNIANAAPGLSNASRRVIVSNQVDFFQDFEANHGAPALEEKTVSFGNEWDTYCASMAEVSARVKRSVEKLRGAEAMATLVSLERPTFMRGRETTRDLAFQNMGLYFEHDFTAVDNPFITERKVWQRRVEGEIRTYVDTLHEDARTGLGGLIGKSGASTRFMVFNALSWSREDYADFPYSGSSSIHVVDLTTNNQVPFQIVTLDGAPHLRIWATDVPAVGYKVFEIRGGAGESFGGAPTANAATGEMSNGRYQLTVTKRGAITSLKDLTRDNREYAAVVDGRTINDIGEGTEGTILVENAGPVSITLRTESRSMLHHTTHITLYRGGDRVDIRNELLETFGGEPTWGYGFAITAPDVWHEEVGAVIRAKLTTDRGHYSTWNARYDFLTLNHFADMSGTIGGLPSGVTLSNADCFMFRLGSSTVETLDTTTPSLNPVMGSDNNGISYQDGDSRFRQRFALQTHDAFDQTKGMKFSLEHQNPFITTEVTGNASSPYPPESFSYLTIDDPDVLLWTLKPHDDGIDHGIAIRVWNQSNAAADLHLAKSVGAWQRAKKVSHIETDDSPLTLTDGVLTDTLAGQKMQTYVLDHGEIEVGLAPPGISPNGGTITGATTVSLSTPEPGASIRYTVDGSTPSATHGTLYSGGFSVSHSTTVKAVTVTNGETSAVSSAGFIITKAVSTMGYDEVGSTWDIITTGDGHFINASRWQAPSSFDAATIKAYISAVTGHYRCAIYSDSGGTTPLPAALLGATAEVTNPLDGWSNFALTSPVPVSGGSYYWLCIWSDTVNAHIRASVGGGTVRYPSPATYAYGPTWPEPLLTNMQYGYRQSIYADSGNPLTAYDQWKQANGLPASTPSLDDSDGDLVPLLIEYALGTDPQEPSHEHLPSVQLSDGVFSFSYLRARTEVAYAVETSTDLVSWTSSGVNQGTGAAGSVITATMAQGGAPQRFFRLRVEEM